MKIVEATKNKRKVLSFDVSSKNIKQLYGNKKQRIFKNATVTSKQVVVKAINLFLVMGIHFHGEHYF
ncbi:unnamed protein product [Allacma fusca]|uniref:Uncharacterized protein n=1 Tax=Allacma fusca TaxID=39272 RepID=A0A8J2LK14_9HEXA|nr:unnamed protein product [Allacma fusca]